MDGPVRLSDVVVPEHYSSYMVKDTIETWAFYNAGVMRPDADLASKLRGGGRTFNIPFWKDLDDEESDVASDDPDEHSSPSGLGSGRDVALRQIRTKSWSSMKLSGELAGSDPLQRIQSRTSNYWNREFDKIAVSTARGVFADNIANDGGDMVNDVSMDTVGTPGAANLFSAEAVMDTAQTMGDEKQALSLIVMHSVVHNRLSQQQLISFRPDAEGKRWYDYYQDYRVHVSDRAPVVQGANQLLYHTYIFGPNAFGWAEVPVDKPVEVESKPSAGAGMGMEILYNRRQFGLHPYGVKWTDTVVGGHFPTNAELSLAANWDRVATQRKQIPMALLITNG